jgi:hypothetical protein
VNGHHAGRLEITFQITTPLGAPTELAQVKRVQRRSPRRYLPREVFLTFDVFFVADFDTGFSGVPAA